MSRSLYVGGSLILLASTTPAQQSGIQAQPVPGPVKHAGVLHVADGTWSRGQEAHLGAETLYNNDASTGFFGLYTATEVWTDEGRLPSCNDPDLPDVDARSYTVQSLELAYCTSQPSGSGTQDVIVAFYEAYASCTDPQTLTPVVAFQVVGLPGGPACGSTACWIVTLDLKGTTFEFDMAADGDGIWDDSTALDNFGWSFIQIDTSCGNAGPLLTGDPNNFPEGDGTYYQNPGATGTGQGTQDQFWLNDAGGAIANGCFWFGGYTTGNPWASFWLQLGGETDGCRSDCFSGEKYCQANPSSCGATCDLSAADQGDGTWVLSASPAPLQPGIFFHAQSQARIPFGNGFLCAAGGIVRLLPPIFPDAPCGKTSLKQNLADYADAGVLNFQYWFRDPDGGGELFNTSNAVSIYFCPI